MNLIKSIKNIFQKPNHKRIGFRQYAASIIDRLTSSWGILNTTADADLRYSIANIRARARELSQNNDYARRYLQLVVTNLIGPAGVTLQNKAVDNNGALDKVANTQIEAGFKDWAWYAGADGRLSWLDIQRIITESVARDGEVLVRMIKGKAAGNKYNFALQVLEADHLDEQWNIPERNIRMGIEYDTNGKPIAYHIWKYHPYEFGIQTRQNERLRISADEIIHIYYKERPSQSRGVSWMHSAMTRLKHLDKYEEAEIVAARVAASKMGFYITPTGDDYSGDKDADNAVLQSAEPGHFEQLPEGWDFKTFDVNHPSGNLQPFIKSTLRGIAAGLNVSYNALASDLEAVSYSSLRYGSLDERDYWMTRQTWMIHTLCVPIFEAWLDMALAFGSINLPHSKIDKFNSPYFSARRWQWVDPEKDINAAVIAINNGLKTRTSTLAEVGLDFEETVDRLAYEQEYMKLKGVSTAQLIQAVQSTQNQNSNANGGNQ